MKFKDQPEDDLDTKFAGINLLHVAYKQVFGMPGSLIKKIKPVFYQFKPVLHDGKLYEAY